MPVWLVRLVPDHVTITHSPPWLSFFRWATTGLASTITIELHCLFLLPGSNLPFWCHQIWYSLVPSIQLGVARERHHLITLSLFVVCLLPVWLAIVWAVKDDFVSISIRDFSIGPWSICFIYAPVFKIDFWGETWHQIEACVTFTYDWIGDCSNLARDKHTKKKNQCSSPGMNDDFCRKP